MKIFTSHQSIITDQLTLRPITHHDAPAIFAYTSDPRVAQFTHWNPHKHINETIDYVHTTHKLANTCVWGIQLHASPNLIGECSITYHENGRAELYYALAHNYWGNGYTTQALQAVLSVIPHIPEIERLEAWIISENRASCRVAEKAGLALEHTIPQAWHVGHTPHDISLYTWK